MSRVDDRCYDFHWEWMKRLWNIAVSKMDDYEVTYSFDDIPDNITDAWHHKFWYFETENWKTKIDNRSLPGTQYNSEVSYIFEYNSNEIVDDMMKYIKKTCQKLTKKKRDVIVDLMVDVQIVPQDLRIPKLEIAMHTIN